MATVQMPQMGFDMQEGKLVRWLKKVGDRIERNEPIAEIETDKAVMEIEAFDGGVITELLVEEGATVPVGEAIAVIDTGDGEGRVPDAVRDAADETPPGAAPAQAEASTAETAAPEGDNAAPAPTADGPAAQVPGERIKASPLARRLAREMGVNLRQLKGTGPGGRIVRADVEAAAAAAPAPAPLAAVPATDAPAGDRQVPLSRMRQIIAQRMVASKQQAPHFYVSMTVDMGEAMAFRRQFNETAGDEKRASVNDLVVKACALALTEFPNINASFGDDVIYYHDGVDISIAVAVEGGLITPIIRDAHTKFLGDIGAEARQLAEAARAGRLRPDQYQGGTFTVSNLGMYGVDDFIAIINPPQAAILAVGAIVETPTVRDGEVVVRPLMRMTLSADHRVTDGAEAAQFLQHVKAVLEQPLRLLMPPGGKGGSQQ